MIVIFRFAAILLLSIGLVGCSQEQASEPAETTGRVRKTNVLLITIDTLRADYLGCYGRADASTPVIDGLAAGGVRFEQAVAQAPLTTPSHASILTGTYPPLHKIRDVGGFVLNKEVPTMAELMSAAGFDTAAFVSAAVLNRRYGLNRGFQIYNDDMGSEQEDQKLPGVVAEVRGHVVTQRAIDWLEDRSVVSRQRSSAPNPFLLWVHYYDPHFPYDPPQPYRQRYAQDGYAGEVAYTDDLIGRLLGSLSRQGLQGNTLIVILSDHGESLGEHGEQTHGVFLYDSTMHIPLIMAGPDLPEGKLVEQQVRSIDLMPTVLDYLEISAGEKVQGTTLLPAMTQGKRVRTDYAYMETLYPKTHMGWSELRAMRTDDWKLVVAPRPELYRLSSDQKEDRNIIEDHSREADRLRQRVQEIAGAESEGEIEYEAMDEETLKQLQALGYVSAGKARSLQFDFSGPDPKDRVQVLQTLDRATDLMNHDRFAAAAPLLERIISDDPTNPLLYQQLGVCLQETRQFRKALQVYERAIEKQADTDRTHAEIGEIHIRFGDLGRAIESMEHAADLNSSNLDNFSNLANAYLQSGRLNDAEGAVKAIFAQDPDHAGGHNLMGLIMIHSGRSALARSHFEQAIQSNPDSAEPYMNLGLLAQQANQPELALGYYKTFVEKAGNQPQFREIVPKVKAAIADLDSLTAQKSQ